MSENRVVQTSAAPVHDELIRAQVSLISDSQQLNIVDMLSRNHEDFATLQFTGLRDKNSKEIYEGDIVTSSVTVGRMGHKGPFLVRWNSYLCNFALDSKGEDFFTLRDKDISQYSYVSKEYKDFAQDFAKLTGAKSGSLRVIGNIYENPELLEV